MKVALGIAACLASMLCSGFSYGLHQACFKSVFENLAGMDDVYREISTGMDSDYCKLFQEKFGLRPSGNHRLMGHSGFNAGIPFQDPLYAKAYGHLPREEVERFWRDYKRLLVEKVMKMTMVGDSKTARNKAKALTGIIYDLHLLEDHTGRRELTCLQNVEDTAADLQRNIYNLFGHHSDYSRETVSKLKAIVKEVKAMKYPATPMGEKLRNIEMAKRIHRMLEESDMGKALHQLGAKKILRPEIRYVAEGSSSASTSAGVMLDRELLSSQVNVVAQEDPIVKSVSREFKNGTNAYRMKLLFVLSEDDRKAIAFSRALVEQSRSGYVRTDNLQVYRDQVTAFMKAEYEKSGQVLDDLAQRRIASSVDRAFENMKALCGRIGLKTGVWAFAITETGSVCQFASGRIDDGKFAFDTAKNVGSATVVGVAVWGAVVLGATPTGWIVIGVGVGTAVACEWLAGKAEFLAVGDAVTLEDLPLPVPAEVFNRKALFEL